ncbi:MAG: hypothetical protein AAF830_06400 [Pseudomonadota bacterium]
MTATSSYATTPQLLRQLTSDLRPTKRGLQVRATGHHVPLTLGTVIDVWRWTSFERALRKAPKLAPGRVKIAFTPMHARPWYFARSIADYLGAEIVTDIADADVVWAFNDATFTDEVRVAPHQLALNANCIDVSKTLVGRLSEEVFGSTLTVDPLTYNGPMVEKSEINGAHDGQIVQGPAPRRRGSVYQRLVDNRIDGGMVEDLRTTIMGGMPVLVFRKRRSVGERFQNSNSQVEMAELTDVFTPGEINQIATFARRLKLDAGGLDVLRDRGTGELFVVDANKTDMGPPMALPIEDKLRATGLMAEALLRHIDAAGGRNVRTPTLKHPLEVAV